MCVCEDGTGIKGGRDSQGRREVGNERASVCVRERASGSGGRGRGREERRKGRGKRTGRSEGRSGEARDRASKPARERVRD